MKPAPYRRSRRAVAAFALTLAAAALVWQNGRRTGQKEAVRFPAASAPPSSPTPNAATSVAAVTIFNDPATEGLTVADYEAQFNAYSQQCLQAKTAEQQRAVAEKFYNLARAAHFRSPSDGHLSLQAYQRALRLFQEIGDQGAQTSVLADMSDTQSLLGMPREAEASLRSALRLHEAGVGAWAQRADRLYRLGDLLRAQGKYLEAKTALDNALELRQQSSDSENESGKADCLSALGQIAFEENSPALAYQLLEEAARLFAKNGKIESRAAVLGQLGDVALLEGKTGVAKRFYQEGLFVWQERKQPFWTGRFLTRLGQAALQENNLPEAKTLSQESRRLLIASNGPVAQAAALLVLGEVSRREGKPQEARQFFLQAQAQYQSAGYTLGLTRCQAALRKLPVVARH